MYVCNSSKEERKIEVTLSATHGGVCSSVLDTSPHGGGGGPGGGGVKFFSILGAFLNSPFHTEWSTLGWCICCTACMHCDVLPLATSWTSVRSIVRQSTISVNWGLFSSLQP